MSLRPFVLVTAVSLLAFAAPGPVAEDVPRAKELLQHFVGSWDVEMTFAGMPPSKGIETNHLLAHGLTIVTEYRAPMGPGQEFEGHGLFGFNPRTGKWTSVWADGMDPAINVSEGTWSEDGKRFTVEDEVDMGMGPMLMAMVTTIIDADHHSFTMSDSKAPEGTEAMVKATYARRAGR